MSPEEIARWLDRGRAPASVLARAIAESPSIDDLDCAITVARSHVAAAHQELDALEALWRSNRDAWTMLRAIAASAPHDQVLGPERWRVIFDRASEIRPEASVALASLGDPELLSKATAEIVERIERRVRLRGARVLDVGCGIGRFEVALAPTVSMIVGVDASRRMLEEAARRTAALANVSLLLSDGTRLPPVGDRFDVALAIDVAPYWSSPDLVAAHLADIARALVPRGTLVLMNYSYRDDDPRDARELAQAAQRFALRLDQTSPRDLEHCDGALYFLSRL